MRRDANWTMAVCDIDAAHSPDDALRNLQWIAARVPGTAATALIESRHWSWSDPVPLDERDVWYTRLVEGHGNHRLVLEGLATCADVFLDDAVILHSENMFVPCDIDIELRGTHRLAIRFHALKSCVAGRNGRARWRPRMIQPPELRFARTSALGHMSGFAPPAPPVGPWRPIRLAPLERANLTSSRVHARLDDANGVIDVEMEFDRAPDARPLIHCEGVTLLLEPRTASVFAGTLRAPGVEKWFPHTHGAPRLYMVSAQVGDNSFELARTGFRTIEVERDVDGRGFALRVNSIDVFCRGAVWTPLDAISLQNDPEALGRTIGLAREAGVNMFRIGGTSVYETDEFYRACDAAGILVWQDFMFSNFDYPAGDPVFAAAVESEARQFLQRTSSSPALGVLCGGNEVYQQAAMMGVAEAKWRSPLFEDLLARVCAQEREDAVYVVNSPSGGALPFHADAGVSHYYGVGAYRRPLEDARRADVRFATECLGFANAPEARTVASDFGAAPLSSPLWSRRIPRDIGAEQDFEQTRDHYLGVLYGVDPVALKRDQPLRYLDFSRAAVAEVMEATIGEWRRPQSSCAGALVWFWKDLWASSGFGVLDWRGEPKSPWWALRRAFRPVQVLLSDEGVNGLFVHCLNERPAPFKGALTMRCFKDGATVVMNSRRDIEIAPHSSLTLRDCEVWGGFFDTAYAYRFGPPAHESTVATLSDAAGAIIAESWRFPLGRAAAMFNPALTANVFRDEAGFGLRIRADRLAQSVKIEDRALIPLDNWLHLAPDEEKIVRFVNGGAAPEGRIAALGGPPLSYRSCAN